MVGFDSVAALQAAPDAAVRGKIVFVTHTMQADPGRIGLRPVRRAAPRRARRSPAARARRRSSSARSAPTITATRIPASRASPRACGRSRPARSPSPTPSSSQRILARGDRPVRMRLTLTPRNIGRRQSGNVVAEVPGSDPAAGVIADRRPSRQLGSRHRRDRQCRGRRDHRRRGAPDHAGGPAAPDDPRRPVRRRGGRRRSAARPISAATAPTATSSWSANPISAPTGSGGSNFSLAPANAALADRIAALLAPLGIVRGRDRANAGADLGAWVARRRRRRSTSTRTAPAISTITTRPTTRSTRSIRRSSARMSPPGRRCSPRSPTRPSAIEPARGRRADAARHLDLCGARTRQAADAGGRSVRP